MQRLTIRHPIHALDRQLLFPPGAVLTKETIETVIPSDRSHSNAMSPLLSYGSVNKDCLRFCSSPPYETIYSGKNSLRDLLRSLETVRLSIPILQSLDYFKENDFYTYAHTLMVFALSTLLANDLIPDRRDCIRLSATGPTHDIGKICVPLPILKKTTPLIKTERSFLEHHAAAGYVLLQYYHKGIQPLAWKVALEHHERKDCSGYPRGIPLQDLLVEIIAVSDVYDALIAPRPYRSTVYDNRTALEEITKMAEQGKIGWDVVKALIAHNRKTKPDYRKIKLSSKKRGIPPPHNVYGMIAEEEKPDSKNGSG